MRRRQVLTRLTQVPGIPQARHVIERIVAPYLRHDLQSLHRDLLDAVRRVEHLERELNEHMPLVTNAIASSNGTSRVLRREMVETVAAVSRRIEFIRAELMNEMRYGPDHTAPADGEADVRIVDPAALHPDGGAVRLNLGAGHIPMEGYANVDARELPGIDVVAPIDRLPVEPGSVDEIFSAHTLEHFPEEQLKRSLLPYWFELLKPGGTFRAVVPDMESMTNAVVTGDMPFEDFRLVTYGGQEYAGDFHFNGFTPASLCALLESTGFDKPELIASGRRNGLCFEFEVVAKRPG